MKIVLLVVLSAAQLTAAAWSIVRYELTLANGDVYKIKTVPVDPADPFRGRYVAIQPVLTLPNPVAPEVGSLLDQVGVFRPNVARKTAYVVLSNDAAGFARSDQVVSEAPRTGDYLEIAGAGERPIGPVEPGRPPEVVRAVMLRFDRYYMAEAAAPAAEQRYREASRRGSNRDMWITIRVRNGVGVIDGLFIDGVRIEDAVR